MNEKLKMDVQAMEQEVRRRWERVEAHWLPAMPNRFRVEMRCDDCMVWTEIVDGLSVSQRLIAECLAEQETWNKAHAFTLAHAQKIRELREEIEQERYHVDIYNRAQAKTREGLARRTSDRLESALAELLNGWKGE